jgi:hypothetical protein
VHIVFGPTPEEIWSSPKIWLRNEDRLVSAAKAANARGCEADSVSFALVQIDICWIAHQKMKESVGGAPSFVPKWVVCEQTPSVPNKIMPGIHHSPSDSFCCRALLSLFSFFSGFVERRLEQRLEQVAKRHRHAYPLHNHLYFLPGSMDEVPILAPGLIHLPLHRFACVCVCVFSSTASSSAAKSRPQRLPNRNSEQTLALSPQRLSL